MSAVVYLIPAPLSDNGLDMIPARVTDAISRCQVFFVENERTTRRYFKQLWKKYRPGEEIVIDNYQWCNMVEHTQKQQAGANSDAASFFRQQIKERKTIGIVSEAGCPGIADPGQALVAIAQDLQVPVVPLVGPSSILLALMASGMNGQQFRFHGYLPIDNTERTRNLRELEADSKKNNCTQLFIETPYRNNQLLDAILKTCKPGTRLCVALDITGSQEWIRTQTVAKWQQERRDLHKIPAIFLLQS